MKKKSILLFTMLSCILQAEQVKSIKFINLTKISPSVAKEALDINVGDQVDEEKINKAVKKFYEFHYFKDISVFNDNGKLKFVFKEKPLIANVNITGYKQRDNDIKLLKKEINLKKGYMYSAKRIKKAKKLLLEQLQKEGYINSVVEVDVKNLNKNSVTVTFNVNKGDKIIIKHVNYFGTKTFSNDDLENVTANRKEEVAPWFFTQNDGELKIDQLQYDSKRIQGLYFTNGYLDAKVGDPFVLVDFSSNQANLDFHIDEGTQYKISSVAIHLNSQILNPKGLYAKLKLKENKIFDIKKLKQDLDYIKTTIADLGYAFAEVKYDIKRDKKNGTADLIYNAYPKQKVYIRDVKISGNERTLDSVIRRNIYMAPGDLFKLTDLNDSKSKLKRSGFFEDVTIEQKRITENKIDLLVKIKEANTGNVILGGGYGSSDGFIFNTSLNEKNIFGSGLGLKVSVDTSKDSKKSSIALSNPAIRDSKFNGDVEIHSRKDEYKRERYELDKKSNGFSLGIGKEIMRNLRAGARYRLDFIKENYDYDDDNYRKSLLSSKKKAYENKDYIISSIAPYIRFNNTNNFYFPSAGFKVGSYLEYAGLGGDSKYIKSSSYFKHYHSLEDLLNFDCVFRYKLRADILIDNGEINQGDSLYLGGISTLRGFGSAAFGPDNSDGTVEDPYKRMATTSLEFSFPLVKKSKMRWGVFYDYGIIGQNNFTDVKRSSTGFLFEWFSPFGPLQLVFAKPLDNKVGDDTSNFEFSIGRSF